MAVIDTIGIFIASASVLVLIAIVGFVLLKIVFASFKIVMEPLKASRGIENVDFVVKDKKYRITGEEEDEFEIISDYIKDGIEKNRYASYLYKRLKIDIVIAHIYSFKNTIDAKIKKNNYTKYAYIQLFKK